MERKLELKLEDLTVESTDIIFSADDAGYAASIIIRTNTDPVPGRTAPTNCCA